MGNGGGNKSAENMSIYVPDLHGVSVKAIREATDVSATISR